MSPKHDNSREKENSVSTKFKWTDPYGGSDVAAFLTMSEEHFTTNQTVVTYNIVSQSTTIPQNINKTHKQDSWVK